MANNIKLSPEHDVKLLRKVNMNPYEESEYESKGWKKCICCGEYKNPELEYMEYGDYGSLGTGWLCDECFESMSEPSTYK